MKIKITLCILTFLISLQCEAAFRVEILNLEKSQLHLTHWISPELKRQTAEQSSSDQGKAIGTRETIILLSGPTDNWNSDSAWFARLAPKLTEHYNVISIDRPAQVLANRQAPLGYLAFGQSLFEAFEQLQLGKVSIVSFASSNLALLKYFQLRQQQPKHSKLLINKIILIDPDVLLPYSISRYTKDADPFKQKLAQYIAYIEQGKYQQRAEQKNQMELVHLRELAEMDKDTDWNFVNLLFSKRLNQVNLVNLFGEIAVYGAELEMAAQWRFPKEISITIFDTDFEQVYIDKAQSEEAINGLKQWQKEASQYYQSITKTSQNGKYIALQTKQHLLPFSQPTLIINALIN